MDSIPYGRSKARLTSREAVTFNATADSLSTEVPPDPKRITSYKYTAIFSRYGDKKYALHEVHSFLEDAILNELDDVSHISDSFLTCCQHSLIEHVGREGRQPIIAKLPRFELLCVERGVRRPGPQPCSRASITRSDKSRRGKFSKGLPLVAQVLGRL